MMAVRRQRGLVAAVAAAAMLAGTATAVVVAAPPSAVMAADDAGPAADDRYRALVRRLWLNDPRGEVNSAARSALIQDPTPAVPDPIAAFLAPGGGYAMARERAVTNANTYDRLISDAIKYSDMVRSPHVHMTAKRAQLGTLQEKERYVRSGMAAARKLDDTQSPVAQAKKQAELDRQYVAVLADNFPGAWVKAAAQRAIQLGTDSDIAEFFKYSWASAAACDLQQLRMDYAEQETIANYRLPKLIEAAKEAQQAYEQASDATRVKAAEDARDAWKTAVDVAASTHAMWVANQTLATSQAASWKAVHDFAAQATTGQAWSSIANSAVTSKTAWADELAWAQKQAHEWSELEASTRRAAAAIPPVSPTAPPSGT